MIEYYLHHSTDTAETLTVLQYGKFNSKKHCQNILAHEKRLDSILKVTIKLIKIELNNSLLHAKIIPLFDAISRHEIMTGSI